MAIRPCSCCHERFRGPAGAAYIAILDGGTRWEAKGKLCPVCTDLVQEVFESVNGRIEYDSKADYVPQPCLMCHGDVDQKQPQSIFMTLYPAGADRVDFFAPVCREHRRAAEIALNRHTKGQGSGIDA